MKRMISGAMLLIFVASCNFSVPSTNTPAPATNTSAPALNTPAPSPTPTTAKPKPQGKPNIIFILADDLDASAIQYMPKLKALIRDQGETFTNYFVSESLCCPSRATTLRGQYAHNTEVTNNNMPTGGFQKFYQLEEEKSTIAVWLQEVGYRTMLAGKYLNGYPLKTDPTYIPPGWSEWYSPMNGDPYSEYTYTRNENGQQVAYGHKPKDYGTDVYVRKNGDFIQRSAKEGKPFFVYLAPYAPHSPYTPAPRHANLFTNLKAPRTPNYNEADVSDKPAYISNRPLLTKKQKNYMDREYRKRVQSLQAVDEGIEAIVKTLKANGQLSNTYIFFTSDNGYHLGNHRQVAGKVSPYEEEMRVTMMVRGPGVPTGARNEHLTGNVDLASTWAELTGAQSADFCDGRSLVPLMRTNPPGLNQWRQAYLYEYGSDQAYRVNKNETPTPDSEPGLLEPQDQDEKDTAAASPEQQEKLTAPKYRGMRLQTLSYVEYTTGEVELYDIKADPAELENLASKADPKLLKLLSNRLNELTTCKAAACRTAEEAPFNLPASITQTPSGSPDRFGIFVSQDAAASQDTVKAAQPLGAGRVRINVTLGDGDQTYPQQYLAAGINVVLMVLNQNPTNIVTDYGKPQKWWAAVFPYLSKEKYQQDIRDLLQPMLSYLKSGQQVWVQGGNEVCDVSVSEMSAFWRGTMDQYLGQALVHYYGIYSTKAGS